MPGLLRQAGMPGLRGRQGCLRYLGGFMELMMGLTGNAFRSMISPALITEWILR